MGGVWSGREGRFMLPPIQAIEIKCSNNDVASSAIQRHEAGAREVGFLDGAFNMPDSVNASVLACGAAIVLPLNYPSAIFAKC